MDTDLQHLVEDARRFNRFYTKQMGVLRRDVLYCDFSLAQSRLIYELANGGETTATALAVELDLDSGHLSRILRSFRKRGLIKQVRSEKDGRQRLLSLTPQGAAAFALINTRSRNQIAGMLGRLSKNDQNRLITAMQTIQQLLGSEPEHRAPFLLRTHEPGDMGWIVHHHGLFFADEFGWNEKYEAWAAETVARFIGGHEKARERCWVAEMDGEIVGSVLLVRESGEVASLKLLLVEPQAQGVGIGSRLVHECLRFAKRAGYRAVRAETASVLTDARRIFQKSGFTVIDKATRNEFERPFTWETWELPLPAAAARSTVVRIAGSSHRSGSSA